MKPLLLFSFFIFHFSLRAVLSEPPNIVCGSIRIDGQLQDSNRTDLIIEARRVPSGAVLARYRLGDVPEFGEQYLLEIPVETPPATNYSPAVVTNTALKIVLRDDFNAQDLAEVNYTVTERGKLQTLNFVISTQPSDTNGLPDDWELFHFGATDLAANADPDHDGRTNLEEYLAGTNPNAADGLRLSITSSNTTTLLVRFTANRAEGAGYTNKSRFFTLESATNAAVGPWRAVTGFTNLFGSNQTVVYVTPPTNQPPAPRFFRTRARLQ